jgi:hypothetical protein
MQVLHIDHVQPAMPPGSESRARGFCSGVLGMKRFPNQNRWPSVAARRVHVCDPFGNRLELIEAKDE